MHPSATCIRTPDALSETCIPLCSETCSSSTSAPRSEKKDLAKPQHPAEVCRMPPASSPFHVCKFAQHACVQAYDNMVWLHAWQSAGGAVKMVVQ
eukprot:scaffold60691_cov20-Tisochrysis_lutea.AAC.1